MNSCNKLEKDDETPDEDSPGPSHQELTAKLQQMVSKGTSSDEVESAIQKQGASTTVTIHALLRAISTVENMEKRS